MADPAMDMPTSRSAFGLARSVIGGKIEEKTQQSGISRTLQGIRSLANTRRYEDLHDDLTRIISQMRITSVSLDSSTLRQMEDQFTAAAAEGSDEDREVAQEQLDALQEIRKLMQGQGEQLAERVLERDTLTNEEARQTVEYLRELSSKSEVLEKSIQVSTAAAFDAFSEALADERVSAAFRTELVGTVSAGLQDSDLFRGGAAAEELRMLAESGRTVTGDTAVQATAALDRMREKLNTAEVLNDLAIAAREDDISRKDLNETLSTMVATMGRIDGFAEEQTHISRLMREDLHGDQDRMDELRRILSRVADRTVESKTLFTLGQLNDKFDAAVLDKGELEEALEKGNLGKEFLENAGRISKGGGFGMDVLPLLGMLGGLDPGMAALMSMLPDFGLAETGLAAAWLGGKGLGKVFGRKGTPPGAPVAAQGNMLQRILRRMGRRGQIAAAVIALGGGGFAFDRLFRGGVEPSEKDVEDELHRLVDTTLGIGRSPAQAGEDARKQAVPAEPVPVPEGLAAADAALLAAGAGGTALAARQVARSMAPGLAMPGQPMPGLPDVKPGTHGLPSEKATVSGTAKDMLKRAKGAGPLGALLSVGFGAHEYMSAEDTAGRKQAVGGNLGAFLGGVGAAAGAGAVAGTAVPGLGNVAGAAVGTVAGIVGGLLGYNVGEMAADWLTSPVDRIPDKVKGHLLAETAVVNAMLASPDLSPEDAEDLEKHKAKLLREGVPRFIRQAERAYMQAGVPPSMMPDQLRAELDAVSDLKQVMPEMHAEILAQADAAWSGGRSALPKGRAVYSPRKAARMARASGTAEVVDASMAAASVDVQADAVDMGDMRPMDVAAPAGQPSFSPGKTRQMARQAGAVPVHAVPGAVSLDGAEMDSAAGPDDSMQDRMDLLVDHSAQPSTDRGTPAAREQPHGAAGTRLPPRRPALKPGAAAPSTAKDDYGIALVNSILFSR